MQWLRLHNKLLNDPAVQRLKSEHFKMYINMLCLASIEGKGGYIGTVDDVSFALRETKEALHSCFIALQEAELIVSNETHNETDGETLHETLHVNKWAKHQYESDSSTNRVKKHRAKVKRSKAVTSTVTVTPPDTDVKHLSATPSVEQEIFDHWKAVMNKNNSAKLNKKRLSAIKARMNEGYSIDDIKLAIDGCANTPHNMGSNDTGELYNDLELICRNGSNVERFGGNLSRVTPGPFTNGDGFFKGVDQSGFGSDDAIDSFAIHPPAMERLK